MTDCPRKYKNLGTEKFGEKRYVTSEMLSQFCKNDAYLYGEVEDLWDTTPPVSRKRFAPVPIDSEKSYCVVETTENCFAFSNETSQYFQIDFKNYEHIDTVKTTAYIDTSRSMATLTPVQNNINKNTKVNGPWGDMICNEYWYVGFNKSRHYETRPNWLKDIDNTEIPAVCRAQVIKADFNGGSEAKGLLENVVLNIDSTNGDLHNCASPFIVEITETYNSGTEDEPVYYPKDLTEKGQTCKTLAREEIYFDFGTKPGIYSVNFRVPATLTQDEHYAIIVKSPLSEHTHCPMLGGWSKHCESDPYPYGDAFLSENNGGFWIKHGKEDDVSYHKGRYAPADFAFECHIRPLQTKYAEDNDEYVYLKPIFHNPATTCNLILNSSNQDNPNTDDCGTDSISYEISNDGRIWSSFTGGVYNFGKPYPQMSIIRAKLHSNNADATPEIASFNLKFDCVKPEKAYLRTKPYYPQTGTILGANVWSKLNAPYILMTDTHVAVDIISTKTNLEHFKIIAPADVAEYQSLISKEVPKKNIETWLLENEIILEELKENNIYVYLKTDEADIGSLSGQNYIDIQEAPAYPIIYLDYQPDGAETLEFAEWIDYTVDYEANRITFNQLRWVDNYLNFIGKGTLTVMYQPLFVQGLQFQVDSKGNPKTVDDEPFQLDFHTETFTVDEEHAVMEKPSFKLEMPSLDPLRALYLNDELLSEDFDFSVDYSTRTVTVFKGLSANDVIRVKYTPNLNDLGLCIAYRLTRENTDNNVVVKPNYIEFKT